MAFISLICLDLGKSCDQEKYFIPIVEWSANLFQFPSVCISYLCTKWNSFADELYSSRKLLWELWHAKKKKKLLPLCVCAPESHAFTFVGRGFQWLRPREVTMDYIKIIEIILWMCLSPYQFWKVQKEQQTLLHTKCKVYGRVYLHYRFDLGHNTLETNSSIVLGPSAAFSIQKSLSQVNWPSISKS